jgi:hypothetical protein
MSMTLIDLREGVSRFADQEKILHRQGSNARTNVTMPGASLRAAYSARFSPYILIFFLPGGLSEVQGRLAAASSPPMVRLSDASLAPHVPKKGAQFGLVWEGSGRTLP